MKTSTRNLLVKLVNTVCLTAGVVGIITLLGFTGFPVILTGAVVAASVLAS